MKIMGLKISTGVTNSSGVYSHLKKSAPFYEYGASLVIICGINAMKLMKVNKQIRICEINKAFIKHAS